MDKFGTVTFIGTIGGGRMELLSQEHAVAMMKDHTIPAVNTKTYELHQSEISICGGDARFLFERLQRDDLDDRAALHKMKAIRSSPHLIGVEVVRIAPYDSPHDHSRRMIVLVDARNPQRIHETVGRITTGDVDDEHDHPMVIWAREKALAMACASHMEVAKYHNAEFFFYTVAPRPSVFIYGGGHVGTEVAYAMSRTGFVVHVFDDRAKFADPAHLPTGTHSHLVHFTQEDYDSARPSDDPTRPYLNGLPIFGTHELRSEASDPLRSFIVIVSRGHTCDQDILHKVLDETTPRYVGMMGSGRKNRTVFKALREKGITDEQLAAVHAPIGIPIGGDTPGEIAISIAAEIIQEWRGGKKHFDDLTKVISDIHT